VVGVDDIGGIITFCEHSIDCSRVQFEVSRMEVV